MEDALKPTTTSVIRFKGKLTFERIGVLLNDLKIRRNSFEIHPVQYKKLLTLMIESLENVHRYSDAFDDFTLQYPQYLPEFELNLNETGFVLISRNPVRNEDRQIISEKINRINASSKLELRKIYRDTITNGLFTDRGGAGLGFIEMAKVVSKALEFNFHPAEAGFSVYELILHVNHI